MVLTSYLNSVTGPLLRTVRFGPWTLRLSSLVTTPCLLILLLSKRHHGCAITVKIPSRLAVESARQDEYQTGQCEWLCAEESGEGLWIASGSVSIRPAVAFEPKQSKAKQSKAQRSRGKQGKGKQGKTLNPKATHKVKARGINPNYCQNHHMRETVICNINLWSLVTLLSPGSLGFSPRCKVFNRRGRVDINPWQE